MNDVEREQVKARFHQRTREAAAHLKAALLTARAANEELKAIQFEQHEATGDVFDALAWFELNVSNDGGETRLDAWMQRLKDYDLDS